MQQALSTFLLLLSLILGGNTCASAQTDKSQQSLSINLEKGQVLSLVAPIPKEGGSTHLKAYYDQAFPLADKYGLRNEGRIQTVSTIIGNFTPSAWTLFTWPSEEAMSALEADPLWPDIKALRPLAWDELKIVSAVVDEDKELRFSADKYYTVAFSWFNPEKPNSYLQYIKNIESILPKVGGRFIHLMRMPVYEVHASNPIAPGQVTFVEWDTIDGLQKLQANEEYQEQLGLLREGTIGFELHLLTLM